MITRLRKTLAGGAVFGVLVLCCFVQAPPYAVASGIVRAPRRGISSATAAINAGGFRAWKNFFDFPGMNVDPDVDVTVSPLVIWYLDRFTGRHWKKPDPAVAAVLKGLVARTALSGAIGINRANVSFTASDVARAHAWNASTSWTPPAGSDVGVAATLREVFEFPRFSLRQMPRQMPYCACDGLRAIRFDSSDGHTQVFIIRGALERLTKFRTALTQQRWARFMSRFRDAFVELDTFALSRYTTTETPSRSLTVFGAAVLPGAVLVHAITGNQTLVMDGEGGHLAVAASLYGQVVPPLTTRRLSDGTVESVAHLIAPPFYDLAPSLPKGQYISLLPPLIYVVVDRPTGIVLLIGMHR